MGSFTRFGIVLTSFVLLFSYFASAIPTDVWIANEYNQINLIPSKIDPGLFAYNGSSITHDLQYLYFVQYKFLDGTNTPNLAVHYMPVWSFGNIAILRQGGGNMFPLEPVIGSDQILAGYDNLTNTYNYTVSDEMGSYSVVLSDPNVTRSDLYYSYLVEHNVTCEITMYSFDDAGLKIKAVDLIMGIMTFQLPNIFGDMIYELGIAVSVILIVPVIWLLFGIALRTIRGVES